MTMLEIHKLYLLAYKKCQQARDQQRDYIGFRQRGDGFQLIASRTACGGKSSMRLGLALPDWASNVLYRLREERFIGDDVRLDEYFELQEVMAELGLRWRV